MNSSLVFTKARMVWQIFLLIDRKYMQHTRNKWPARGGTQMIYRTVSATFRRPILSRSAIVRCAGFTTVDIYAKDAKSYLMTPDINLTGFNSRTTLIRRRGSSLNYVLVCRTHAWRNDRCSYLQSSFNVVNKSQRSGGRREGRHANQDRIGE